MTDAISSFGTLLKIGGGGTAEQFTTIAEVRDISGPPLGLGTEEVTSQSSPGGWREFVPTLLEAGEVTFDLNFVPTDPTHSYSAGLIDDMVSRTLRNFELVFPDTGATTWAFAAYVTGVEPDEPVEGALAASVTLTISGQPTLE